MVVQYFAAENRHLDALDFSSFVDDTFGWIWLVQSINTSSSARHQEKDKSWTLQILCVEDSWETNSLLWKITILIGKSTINGPFFAYQRVIKKTCKMEKVFHMQTTRTSSFLGTE